ncbi:MAG TPA: type II toxin-antitoxin system VapC family toxin [Solirubrobacterales bacterium]|jgi:predicted nucleic acid-binding protein
MADTLLLDASVFVAAWDEDNADRAAALGLVLDTDRPAAALDLTMYEVANAIGARCGDRVGAARVCRSIERRCQENVVRIERDLLEAAVDLAIEHRLTSYDATYVAVARRHGWTLVSLDIKDLVSKGLAVTPDAAV